MAQPQSQMPQQVFSPPQLSPSPAGSQSGFALPPNKRARTDGPPSQPESPYAVSPYAASPGATITPPAMTSGSPPAYPAPSVTQGGYTTPYTNGHTTPGLNLPEARPNAMSPGTTPHGAVQSQAPQYTTARMAPLQNAPAQSPGIMGPPQRPADRPTKDYEYDVTDSLAGTGIDLRAEEQYMSELYSNNAFDSEVRTGFARHPPGPKSTFYGAGPANQPAQPALDQDQQRFAAQAAEEAWGASSVRLANQRTQEMNDPFLFGAMMHRQADKIAREHHLGLNLDSKNTPGKPQRPEQFPNPTVKVNVKPGLDSTMVHTTASLIPHDAYLVDQLALLSLAAKQRLRELIQDACLVANTRQKTAHGEVPEEWQEAAAPMNVESLGPLENGDASMDVDDAASPGTNPLKREFKAQDHVVCYTDSPQARQMQQSLPPALKSRRSQRLLHT